jgi:hypothetical protein
MAPETLGFFSRLFLALLLPIKVLLDGQLAAAVARLQAGAPAAEFPEQSGERVKELEAEVSSLRDARAAAAAEAKAHDPSAAALQFLAILQRDGRLVDFLAEDVAGFSDAEVGAAARLVHDGCKKVLKQYFPVEPIRKEEEGASITVAKGFDPREIRLTGNVTGEPPYKGALAHAGWRVTSVNLPELARDADPTVVAPAEVELS